MKIRFIIFLSVLLTGCRFAEPYLREPLKFWFEESAGVWEESIPLGNGRIGLMPDGGVEHESIVLNEISMWSGSIQDTDNTEARRMLPVIRSYYLKVGMMRPKL